MKLLTYKSLFISWKKINKSMVLKLLKLMLNIINVLSKLSLRIISLPNFKRRILKLRVDLSNNKLSMKQLDLIEIFTPRIYSKLKRKLLNWKWSSDEWLSKSLISKKKSDKKIKLSFLKKRNRKTITAKTLN